MNLSLQTQIKNIPRILPAYSRRLLKLNVKTLEDLFYHFPSRYQDFSCLTKIADLKPNQVATVQGKIISVKNNRSWKKRINITEVFLADKSGTVRAIWFNQTYLVNTLKQDGLLSLSGKVSFDKTFYFSNPSYEKLGVGDLRHTGRLVPVYPETKGLSSRYLRYLIQLFFPALNSLTDWLPPEIKKSQKLIDLKTALKEIHFPTSPQTLSQAKRRLAFEEIFLIQTYALQQKIKWQKSNAPKIPFNQELIKNFVTRLPFKLTDAQRKSAWEILQDIDKPRPMNRLLEGDVGSGKTVVAAIAALQTIKDGWQVAFMAPTEILAQQHFSTLKNLLKKSGESFQVNLLTGSLEKKETIKNLRFGQVDLVVGTHALIQKNVSFKKLGLVIVDEQHRFGVQQRAALQKEISQMDDGSPTTIPHLLSMTATPIPRTLALSIYGDLDLSLLDQMPKNRQKVITKIVLPHLRSSAYSFIRQEISAGRQAFVICPRIEEAENENNPLGSAASEVKAVKKEAEKLAKQIFPEFKVAMLHGKMKSKEKEKIMADFSRGKINILVSTSVVEVGVDIPNASVMMIEGADRFGLSQLHQFRGRVGRSHHQSYCFLLPESTAAAVNQRLKAMTEAKNGFELAQKDLEIRGPGQLYGSRQWGLPDLSMASLTDLPLIRACRQEAGKILQKDPALKNYPLLQKRLTDFQLLIHME